MAPLAVLGAPIPPRAGGTEALHLGNENVVKTLGRNNDKPDIFTETAQLARCGMKKLGIAPLFDRVPSGRNIADLPKRRVNLPYPAIA